MHHGGDSKSIFSDDPKTKYCVEHTFKPHPAQLKLLEATMKHPEKVMIGAPEVVQMGTNLIRLIKAKQVLDVGTFTGFSALSWALAVPADGRVITMDVSDKSFNEYGKKIIEESGVAGKIEVRIQPALKTLDDLIAGGQKGRFDFAFLDADKTEYPQYYDKCVELLRPGGVIMIDNALWGGHVLKAEKDKSTQAIDTVNKKAFEDDRVDNILLPIGDGLHLIFKK